MNENPTNIPRVPPMFPTKDIDEFYGTNSNFISNVATVFNDYNFANKRKRYSTTYPMFPPAGPDPNKLAVFE